MNNNPNLDIFISASLKYPELNFLKYEADVHRILIEVAIYGEVDSKHKKKFINNLTDCLVLYHNMIKDYPEIMDLEFLENSGISFLHLYRDADSLSKEEIELFVALIREEFGQAICQDDYININASMEKQIKKSLMQELCTSNNEVRNFLTYRDEGRVFVFNK